MSSPENRKYKNVKLTRFVVTKKISFGNFLFLKQLKLTGRYNKPYRRANKETKKKLTGKTYLLQVIPQLGVFGFQKACGAPLRGLHVTQSGHRAAMVHLAMVHIARVHLARVHLARVRLARVRLARVRHVQVAVILVQIVTVSLSSSVVDRKAPAP
jgi:hypothetical protein